MPEATQAAGSTHLLVTVGFYTLAALTVGAALVVAFSRNLVRSAFSLLGTFVGVAGLFAMLGSDFVAVMQLMIYVGGILVLILFAVMLTTEIVDMKISSRVIGIVPGIALAGLVLFVFVYLLTSHPWDTLEKSHASETIGTTARIGEAFLTSYILPFEIASVVLLVALIGAAIIARPWKASAPLEGACKDEPSELPGEGRSHDA